MGIKGVAAWVGGIAGGLVLAVAAGFFFMPHACGCTSYPDPDHLVGMTGPEISAETDGCDRTPLEVPRGPLTWWTVKGGSRIASSATGEWMFDTYSFPAVPYGSPDAKPQTVEARVQSDLFGNPVPEGTGTLHLALSEDGTIPFGILETTWGAAYFVDGCAEKGLRTMADGGTLTDAQVAAWPTFDAAEIERLYGPAPVAPEPITLDSLNQVVTPDGQQVSVTLLATGDMPASDKVWLVTGDGLLHGEPFTGIVSEETMGLGVPVAPGQLLGVVLERNGAHYLIGTLTMPRDVTTPDPMATTVNLHYERLQPIASLEGGDAQEVPTVVIPPLHFS